MFCYTAMFANAPAPAARGKRSGSLARRVLAALLGSALVFTATVLLPASPSAAATSCPGGAMNIVAHTDDDLLFLSPDFMHDIQARRCLRTVFTTAGEAGEGKAYWSSLEAGIRDSYAQMAGVANSWTTSDAGISGRSIVMQTLNGAPNISVVFMRLPDGFPNGDGSARYLDQSILKLWDGRLSAITPVDNSAPYTKAQFQSALNRLATNFEPTTMRTQDWTGSYTNPYDHSDHWATAKFAQKASQAYTLPHTTSAYDAYVIDEYPQNVFGDDLTNKIDTFVRFAGYDMYICNSPGEGCPDSPYDGWLPRQYITAIEWTGNAAKVDGATVSASSQKSAAQSAEKARDGYAWGAPMDASREWVTAGGKAGSWIQYSFASSTTLNAVTLFDRPVLTDQITGGTLDFSDGSSVPVSALPDNGSGLTISFPARTVNSVRLSITGVSAATTNVGLAEFEAYLTADTAPPVVTASPVGGTYPAGQQVTLTANETAQIYYTTNGTTPTTASAKYTGPIGIGTGLTLKYFAVDTAGNASAVASQTYTVTSDTTPPVVTATPLSGQYPAGQQITLTADEAAQIYYTTDGTTPTSSSAKYTGPLTLNGALTLSYFAVDAANNASIPASQSYTVPADTTPPVVSAAPPAGTYPAGQQITLSANETAQIYYTTDGTTPTSSSAKYTGPLTLNADLTLEYFGVDAANNASAVVSQTYTVTTDTTLPVVTASPVAGTYPAGQQITLAANEPAQIYFTTNGTTPTTASTKYTGALTLTGNFTLKYFAVDTAGNASAPASQAYTVAPPGPPSFRDFNGDGRSDVLGADSSGALWLYPGDGAGGVLARTQASSGWTSMTATLTPGDFNGGGKPDVLARDSSGNLWLYPGNGTGGFLARTQVGWGWNVMTSIVAPGDFSGDGKPDLLARDSNGNLWLYPGNGSGGWLARSQVGWGWNVMNAILSTGDFNGDGKTDVLARDTSNVLWLYPGNGSGGWLARSQVATGWSGLTPIVGPGDFNGDGKSDVLARDSGGTLWLYPGNGAGGLLPRVQVGTGWNTLTVIA